MTQIAQRGRYVWAMVVKAFYGNQEAASLVSWNEAKFMHMDNIDLRHFRFPTTQELLDLFQHDTGECKIKRFQELLDKEIERDAPFWTCESSPSNMGDVWQTHHVVTPFGEFRTQSSVDLAYPLFVHVVDTTPLKRLTPEIPI